MMNKYWNPTLKRFDANASSSSNHSRRSTGSRNNNNNTNNNANNDVGINNNNSNNTNTNNERESFQQLGLLQSSSSTHASTDPYYYSSNEIKKRYEQQHHREIYEQYQNNNYNFRDDYNNPIVTTTTASSLTTTTTTTNRSSYTSLGGGSGGGGGGSGTNTANLYQYYSPVQDDLLSVDGTSTKSFALDGDDDDNEEIDDSNVSYMNKPNEDDIYYDIILNNTTATTDTTTTVTTTTTAGEGVAVSSTEGIPISDPTNRVERTKKSVITEAATAIAYSNSYDDDYLDDSYDYDLNDRWSNHSRTSTKKKMKNYNITNNDDNSVKTKVTSNHSQNRSLSSSSSKSSSTTPSALSIALSKTRRLQEQIQSKKSIEKIATATTKKPKIIATAVQLPRRRLTTSNYNQHDQLPHIEEYKATVNNITSSSSPSVSSIWNNIQSSFTTKYTSSNLVVNKNKNCVDSDDDDDDDETRRNHQLPHVEEYKASYNNSTASSINKNIGGSILDQMRSIFTLSVPSSLSLKNNGNDNIDQDDSIEIKDEQDESIAINDDVNGTRKKKRFIIIISVAVLIVLGLIIIMAIIIPVQKHNKSNKVDKTTTGNALPDIVKKERLYRAIQLVTAMGWSDPVSFLQDTTGINNTMRSVQYEAIHYIANIDTEVPLDGSDNYQHFLQRYVLAILYYSTGGPTLWNYQYNFLKPYQSNTSTVCDWNSPYQTKKSSLSSSSSSSSMERNNNNNSNNENEYELVGVICDDIINDEYDNEDELYNKNSRQLYNQRSRRLNETNNNNEIKIQAEEGLGLITRIYLPSNNLRGTIPTEIRLLTNLREINFYNNKIHGTIPSLIQELTKLQALILYRNEMNGTIPEYIPTSLPHLSILNLGQNNKITGTIPATMNESSSLRVFNCEHCSLDGTFDNLYGMSKLQSVQLSSNQFVGSISNELFESWKNLIEFDINSNQLTGIPPKTLFSNPKLKIIDLHSNQFEGNITDVLDDVSAASQLRVVSLRNNNFTGPLAPWIYQFPIEIQHIGLSNNQFTGTIPKEIGYLTDLKFLYIAKNYILSSSTTIPTEIGLLTKLQDLSFQQSNIHGTIPTEIGQLSQLVLFDLMQNQLSGPIPTELGLLSNVHFVLISHNHLNGTIPITLGTLPSIDSLLINNNTELTGTTDPICHPRTSTISKSSSTSRIRVFKADCTQYTTGCKCCTTCCDTTIDSINVSSTSNGSKQITSYELNITAAQRRQRQYCDASVFFSEFDPTSEYSYVRKYYKLHENDITFPVSHSPDSELPMYVDNNNNNKSNGQSDPFGPLSVLLNGTDPSSETSFDPYGNNDASRTNGNNKNNNNSTDDDKIYHDDVNGDVDDYVDDDSFDDDNAVTKRNRTNNDNTDDTTDDDRYPKDSVEVLDNNPSFGNENNNNDGSNTNDTDYPDSVEVNDGNTEDTPTFGSNSSNKDNSNNDNGNNDVQDGVTVMDSSGAKFGDEINVWGDPGYVDEEQQQQQQQQDDPTRTPGMLGP